MEIPPLFVPLLPLLATGPFIAAIHSKCIWYLPPATNTRAELKGTGRTAKFQQAFYLQNLPNLTLAYLKPLPYKFILHLYLITTLQLNLTNLTTKPYKPYKTLPPIGTLNSYIFVVCSIWCKTQFIVVVVVYKFCCTKSRSFPFFKSCQKIPTAVEVRFILLQNIEINRAFRGL